MEQIYLAGGCFWGVEEYFRNLTGVTSTKVGYANGIPPNPSYEEVCSGTTNHAETVKLTYNQAVISLNSILQHFFKIINPCSLNQQGNDIGSQYRTGIYYINQSFNSIQNTELTKNLINTFIQECQKNYTTTIQVEVLPLIAFYEAEAYHQKYLQKNPNGYCHIPKSLLNTAKLSNK